MKLDLRLAVILFTTLFYQVSYGQKYSVHKKNKSYFGLTGGFNFTLPNPTERYTVLSTVGSTESGVFDKEYDKFGQNRGAQFGMRYTYNFSNSMSILVGFGYQSVGFNYFTSYSWSDTMGVQTVNREMHHLQKISYFTLPIMARWDIGKRQLMPYMQGGLFMDFRHQAKKVINYDNTIDGEETENQLSSSEMVSLTDQIRKFNMGLVGGVGISYYTKFFTFGIESNFRYGFFKIVNDENRYSDLTGFALLYLDVLDQLRLSNLNVQFTLSIPINHSVEMNILRRKSYKNR